LAAALAVGLLVAGCGSSTTSSTTTPKTTSTAAKPPLVSQHPTKPAPKHHPGHVIVVHLPPKPPVIKAGALIQTLAGNGDRAIANLSEKTTVVLEWQTSTPPIQIFNKHGFVLVNSPSATGEVRLARGKYTGLRVATKGAWTLEIRASA
jgi:hypothetical protein